MGPRSIDRGNLAPNVATPTRAADQLQLGRGRSTAETSLHRVTCSGPADGKLQLGHGRSTAKQMRVRAEL